MTKSGMGRMGAITLGVVGGVALAVVAWFLLSLGGPTDNDLVRAVRGLAREHEGALVEFHPISRYERLSKAVSIEDAQDIVRLSPHRVVLSARPTFLWRIPQAMDSMVVRLLGDRGVELWSQAVEGNSLEYPEDQPDLVRGRMYSWEFEGKGPDGALENRGPFLVLSEEEAEAYRRDAELLASIADSEVAAILQLHYALRRQASDEIQRLAPIVREMKSAMAAETVWMVPGASTDQSSLR